MDVITAAAAMTAVANATSEQHVDDETQGPPKKRLRRPRDASSSSSDTSTQPAGRGAHGTHGAVGTLATPGAQSIDLCPLCGNATFKQGGLPEEVDIVARGQVGGVVAAGTGRYKIRKEPRKDNRLAAWYSRFGYRGPLYCKACSGTHCIPKNSPPPAFAVDSKYCSLKHRHGVKPMSHCLHCRKFPLPSYQPQISSTVWMHLEHPVCTLSTYSRWLRWHAG